MPEPEPERVLQPEPDWVGPRRGVRPGLSIQRVLLCRIDDVLLQVSRFDVYRSGVEFDLELFLRSGYEEVFGLPWDIHHHRGVGRGERGVPDDFLRFGVQLADGQAWSNLTAGVGSLFDERPDSLVVLPRSGGGDGGHWQSRYWLWPLPADGDIVFYAEWPSQNIAEISATVDGDELRQRAAEAEILWS